jgi:hypothetical protein
MYLTILLCPKPDEIYTCRGDCVNTTFNILTVTHTCNILISLLGLLPKARFRRRTFHVLNLMQMSSNKDFRSLTLGSAHVKFGI